MTIPLFHLWIRADDYHFFPLFNLWSEIRTSSQKFKLVKGLLCCIVFSVAVSMPCVGDLAHFCTPLRQTHCLPLLVGTALKGKGDESSCW